MMAEDDVQEHPLLFSCEGEQLVGVLTQPSHARELGVIIVVGGPQYRVGSHRQFVLLARCLARNGFPVTRFDYRGMGDSTGSQRNFEAVAADIRAAIDATTQRIPGVKRVALWGLCDGASAAMMYAPTDSRVAGLVLANPWARGPETLAQARLKHYYLQRLLSADFWTKVLSGGFNLRRVAADFGANVAGAASSAADNSRDYRARMIKSLRRYGGHTLLLLSTPDLTAQEFLLYMNASNERLACLSDLPVVRVDMADADHTFSSASVRERAEKETTLWLQALDKARHHS